MTDYIKREDAIKALGEEPYVWSDTDAEIAEHAQWVSDVKAIEAVPSANVVEIKKEGEWDMFDLISSAWYGKGMYFKQDNGTVYSRHSGKYMTVDEAIKEFISLIDEDVICVPSVTTVWGDGEAPTYVLQKRGKWEKHNDDVVYWWQCSECECVTFYEDALTNFCPNCGADMRHSDD